MKKNYLFLAAATTLFAACVQTDVVTDIPEPQQQAISFETFANKQTRANATAENSGTAYSGALSNHHTSFYVWASKQVTDNTQLPATTKYVSVYAYDNPGTVSYANSTWTASPLKYWDKTATSYEFYAAAPAITTNDNTTYGWVATNTNGANGYLTFNNYVLTGASTDNLASKESDSWKDLIKTNANGDIIQQPSDIDLMIAAPCNVLKANYNTTTPSDVNLDFYHILSRLNINVKAETTVGGDNGTPTYSPNIKLTALDVVGLMNKGTFTEKKITTSTVDGTDITTITDFPDLASGTNLRWGQPTTDNTFTYTLGAYLGDEEDELQLTDELFATHKYLIIPQTVTGTSTNANIASAPRGEAYLKIKYTVDEEAFEAYYSLATAFGVETLYFNEGWQNTLNITISPVAITFTADAAVWADQENTTDTDTNESQDDLTIQ